MRPITDNYSHPIWVDPTDDDPQPARCFGCGEPHPNPDTPDGVYCLDCAAEGWVV